MSVILYERGIFARLADWLIAKDAARDIFFSPFTHEEETDIYWTEKKIWSGRDFDVSRHRRSRLAQWADRLFIANQLAFFYTYDEEDPKIERLGNEDIGNGPGMSPGRMLEVLEGIHYNIYTNGGNCFLGKTDEKRLKWYIDQLKDKLLEAFRGDR